MDLLTQPLDDDMKAELETLRQAVRRMGIDAPQSGLPVSMTPVVQADRILKRLTRWLLDDEQRQVMRDHPWQVFFLHAAACLCDIGMMDGSGVSTESRVARRSHDWILRNWQALGIKDAQRAGIVALICLQMQDSSDLDPAPVDSGPSRFAGSRINTKLIASSVRLARALELKSPATFMAIAAHGPVDPNGKSATWMEAFDVDGVGPHPYVSATIRVKISCRDPELHRALKHHERVVLEQLTNINQRIRPRFLFADLIYEIEPAGYQPVDLKYTVDTAAALQLFMGNRLYSDKRVFLRELIQNAVDACSMRKLAEKAYVPAISIAFNDDISRITIRDNGIGMDRQWLEKYFLSIGISFYQSDEVKTVNGDPRIDIGFISQFGIGFLSSFLVAEKIVIKTRKGASPGLMITITSLKDYFDVRPLGDDAPAGTEVTLYLKPSKANYCRSIEFVGYLKTNIRFLQIPVSFSDERGNTTTLGNEPLSYAVVKDADSDFVAPVTFDDAEGFIYLGAKMHDSRIFALETATGGVSVFQDGIFVTQDDLLLPEGARQHVVGRINLKGRDKCELSMDRNRIFWTGERKKQIRQRLRLALVDVANRLMNLLDAPGTPMHTRSSLINQLAIFFDFSDVDDEVHDGLCQPLQQLVDKRFRDFVRVHFPHARSAGGIPEADGYNERWQRRILASFAPKR
jgi:hypothetical protein